MAIAGLLVVCLLLVGCATVNVNVSSGTGRHELGPDDATSWESSKDSQSASDTTTELQSKISGIDRSQNEITKNLDKQTDMMKQSRERDHAIDKASPDVPKEVRKTIYKRDK